MLLQHREQRRRDEDRRVGPACEADQQGEAEVLQCDGAEDLGAEDQHRENGKDRDQRGIDGPGKRLVHREVHDVGVGKLPCRAETARVVPHPVEHHDRVVQRVAEDRQERHDGVRRDEE